MGKTTKELLELMKRSTDYHSYAEENRGDISRTHMRIDRALAVLLSEQGLRKSDVIARSGIENHYAYQIFSGMKTPTRDKVIMLCFGFEMTADDAIQFMKITGYPPLYAKEERDNAILYGLTKRLSVVAMNALLDDLHQELLI